MPEFVGQLKADPKMRVGIVVARFNEIVTRGLLQGATDGLQRFGVDEANITTAWVPGAVELPLVAKTMAKSGNYDAVICIGCVIQGETRHFDFVAQQASAGIGQLNVQCDIPVVFGVLTCDTLEQAICRSGATAGNKGLEAATVAVEMVDLMAQLDSKGATPYTQPLAQSKA